MATCSSILAWKIPRMEKSGEVQSTGSQSRTEGLYDTVLVSAVGKAEFPLALPVCGGAWPVTSAAIQGCWACPLSTGPARPRHSGRCWVGARAWGGACVHERMSTCGPVPLHPPHGPPSTLRFNMLLRIVYVGESESHLVVSDSLWPHGL